MYYKDQLWIRCFIIGFPTEILYLLEIRIQRSSEGALRESLRNRHHHVWNAHTQNAWNHYLWNDVDLATTLIVLNIDALLNVA